MVAVAKFSNVPTVPANGKRITFNMGSDMNDKSTPILGLKDFKYDPDPLVGLRPDSPHTIMLQTAAGAKTTMNGNGSFGNVNSAEIVQQSSAAVGAATL
jgi:hypothetical protein